MKPFRFTLESVYRLRQEAVDRANDLLAREMLELKREQQNFDQIGDRMEQAREGFREAVSSGAQSGLIVQLRQFVVSVEQERTHRESIIEGMKAKVNSCQNALIAAKRKLEAMEKIKAKRLGEHKAKWSREEQKELDEMMIRSVDSELRVDYA
ncbi:MAG: flagellar export protein FliJ [Verrucomicrobiota bacterium]|jgi:flagellar export protein FliJ|nr:flagellar export protein FliJ [Verrucomicrobiota bacterium]